MKRLILMKQPLMKLTVTMLASLATMQSHAATPGADAAELSAETLTWFGAEVTGNADGSIPAYTGGLEESVLAKGGNPYASETPLFSITGQNMSEYADKLSEGQKALLKKFPDYRMDIYPTQRDYTAPKYVQENTLQNASRCNTIDEGDGVDRENCYGGLPFPVPNTGKEVMWNYMLRVHLPAWKVRSTGYIVNSTGRPVMTSDSTSIIQWPYYDPAKTRLDSSVYRRVRVETNGPTRSAGESLMQFNHANPKTNPMQVWQYMPGQRRVRQAPELAFDTPQPQAGGIITMDQAEVYQGSPERYDMELLGKREIYVLNNNYSLRDKEKCGIDKLLSPTFVDPDCLRWELQRAWVVEATLKSGRRHILPKRVFYVGEDGSVNIQSDDYDSSGELYRTVFRPVVMLPNGEGELVSASQWYFLYDFTRSAYLAFGLIAETGVFDPVRPLPERDFTPEALAASGRR